MDLDIELEQAIAEEDKPPSTPPRPATAWRVAVITTSRGEIQRLTHRQIAGAEPNRQSNLATTFTALRQRGLQPMAVPTGADIVNALARIEPDICINLMAGPDTPSQAARLATVLEMLGLPFTGSRPVAQALAADTPLCHDLWQQAGLPVADSCTPIRSRLQVMVLGKAATDKKSCGPIGLWAHSQCFEADGFHRLPIWQSGSPRGVTADMSPELREAIHTLAIHAHQSVGALDYSLVKIALGATGEPSLLSIQTQPDLTPSGLAVRLAAAGGWRYGELLSEILTLGSMRFGLPIPQPIFQPVRLPLTVNIRRLAPVSVH